MKKLLIVVLACPLLGQQLLEDFSTWRLNQNGSHLFDVYSGESGGAGSQSASVAGDVFTVVGAPTNCGGANCGVYWNFLPLNTMGWYDFPDSFAQTYIKSGTWSVAVNRLELQVMCNQPVVRRPDGGPSLEIGTYIRNHTESQDTFQGQHYYHQMDPSFYPGFWAQIVLNEQPQHVVSAPGSVAPALDPEWAPGNTQNVHYMDGLTRWYFDGLSASYGGSSGWTNQTCGFRNIVFNTVSGEPDAQVASLMAT